jgi:hypothetical protein
MDQFSRRIVGFGVHAGDIDGFALCRMFNSAISNKGLPQRISSDNDPLFRYCQWRANLRILEVEEIKSVPVHGELLFIDKTTTCMVLFSKTIFPIGST